jgi:hypothetical protein
MKIRILPFILGIFMLSLAGCSKASSADSAYMGSRPMADENSAPYGRAQSSEDGRSRSANTQEMSEENASGSPEATIRKLVTNSNLELRSENLDIGVDKLNELIDKYGTYAANISIRENSRHYTLKVPALNYKYFLEEVMKLGKIINYNETTEDVTLKYFDLESRLNTKRELIKTYQGYLNKAKTIEEILSVESRIQQLQAEIDDVGRQFRLLSDLIDYSTIRLDLLGPVAVSHYEKDTVWEKIKSLASGFGDYVSAILIVLLAIAIYGIPSIIILLLLYWLLFGKIGLLKRFFKFITGVK